MITDLVTELSTNEVTELGGSGGATPLTDLLIGGFGDSTMEQLFTQYTGAGETAFEDKADEYYTTANFYEIARSGSFLFESTALAVDAGNTNLFWLDDSAALAKGQVYINQIDGDSNSADCYICSLGINDNSEIVNEGKTAADVEEAFTFITTNAMADKGISFVTLNTLGRDAGGDDAGCNILREGIVNAIKNNTDIKRGIDVYDLPLNDNKHLTQAGYEAMGERMAIQTAYYTNNTTTQAIGARIASATYNVDEVTINLSHVTGNDIVAPASGNGGIDTTDDGVQMGSTALTRVNATTMKLTYPQGKAPVYGSTVKLYLPFGADGGLNGASPDVALDNNDLPIQSDVVTLTNTDPVFALDNVASYFDARGSAKTMTGTEVEAITALRGVSLAEVDAGDHAIWDASINAIKYQANTQLLYSSDFTAGSVMTLAFHFKFPDPIGSGDVLFFANSGSGTDNQAKITQSGGILYYANNQAGGSQAISGTLTAGSEAIMILEFASASVCNVYWDGEATPSYTFDPVDDYNAWTRILLGARTAGSENSAYADLGIKQYLHTLDVLTAQEKEDLNTNWLARPSSAPFSLSSISDSYFIYDKATSLNTVSSGGDISQWDDDGASSLHATQTNAADKPALNLTDNSIVFDGANTEYLNLPSAIMGANSFSFAFRFKCTDFSNFEQRFLYFGDFPQDEIIISLIRDTTGVSGHLYFGLRDTSANTGSISSTLNSVSIDTWYDAVIYLDRTTPTGGIILNKVDISSGISVGSISDVFDFVGNSYVGGQGTTSPFFGELSYFALYNKILNTQEISNLYDYGNL